MVYGIRESHLLLKCTICLNLQICFTFWQSDHNPMISSQIPCRPLTVKLKAISYFLLEAMACHAATCTIIIIKFANLSPCVTVAQSVRRFEWYPKGPKFNTRQGHLFPGANFLSSVFAKNPRIISSNPNHDGFSSYAIIFCI